jgi:hypothetical protein
VPTSSATRNQESPLKTLSDAASTATRSSVPPVNPSALEMKPESTCPSTPPGALGSVAESECSRSDSSALLAAMSNAKPMSEMASVRRFSSSQVSTRRYRRRMP